MLVRKTSSAAQALDPALVPGHVAIIMDGNRRWARERRMPIAEGYRRGMISLRESTRAASEFGVKMLTVYGFSTENWRRDRAEIDLLFELCCAFARAELEALVRENVSVRVLGRFQELPDAPRAALEDLTRATRANDGTVLNLAVNYSARTELRDAARALAEEVRAGRLAPHDIDENTLGSFLYTADLPDPDLLIRPGGEHRLSNFLLYQLAYTELYVTDAHWPEFTRDRFYQALLEYQSRQRRFGK